MKGLGALSLLQSMINVLDGGSEKSFALVSEGSAIAGRNCGIGDLIVF
jgi:hypothetical protein